MRYAAHVDVAEGMTKLAIFLKNNSYIFKRLNRFSRIVDSLVRAFFSWS